MHLVLLSLGERHVCLLPLPTQGGCPGQASIHDFLRRQQAGRIGHQEFQSLVALEALSIYHEGRLQHRSADAGPSGIHQAVPDTEPFSTLDSVNDAVAGPSGMAGTSGHAGPGGHAGPSGTVHQAVVGHTHEHSSPCTHSVT